MMNVPTLSQRKEYQQDLTDEELVHRVREGETYLFELITRRYNQRLFRIIQSILKNDQEAQDVMQDAYVRAYIHLDQFGEKAKFSTWLTKIAVYESLARLKRAKRLVSRNEWENYQDGSYTNLASGNPERILCQNRVVQVLENAIRTLPAKYMAVFILRKVEGLSTEETSACLGISEQTTKTRLHRARFLLRGKLGKGVTLRDLFPFAGKRCSRMSTFVMETIRSLA
jgi:RNA polymerase sigma-70 factor, ECF subfamily